MIDGKGRAFGMSERKINVRVIGWVVLEIKRGGLFNAEAQRTQRKRRERAEVSEV